MELLTMQHNAVYFAIANPNGFEKSQSAVANINLKNLKYD